MCSWQLRSPAGQQVFPSSRSRASIFARDVRLSNLTHSEQRTRAASPPVAPAARRERDEQLKKKGKHFYIPVYRRFCRRRARLKPLLGISARATAAYPVAVSSAGPRTS